MKKKGFTLIEMIIVIGIVGVIFSMGMNLSWSRIGDYQAKEVKEKLIIDYGKIVSNNYINSYIGKDKYSKLSITISSGNNRITTEYVVENKTGFKSDIILNNMVINSIYQTGFEFIKLELLPMNIGCNAYIGKNKENTINNLQIEKENITFSTQSIMNGKLYCFIINTGTCKISNIKCEKSNQNQ